MESFLWFCANFSYFAKATQEALCKIIEKWCKTAKTCNEMLEIASKNNLIKNKLLYILCFYANKFELLSLHRDCVALELGCFSEY